MIRLLIAVLLAAAALGLSFHPNQPDPPMPQAAGIGPIPQPPGPQPGG